MRTTKPPTNHISLLKAMRWACTGREGCNINVSICTVCVLSFSLSHIPVGLSHIFRVTSSVQQQLLPCEDNNNDNNNNNNNKINAHNNNSHNKILGTQSKSAACRGSLGGVGPLVCTMYELSGGGYTTSIRKISNGNCKKQVRVQKSTTKHTRYMYIRGSPSGCVRRQIPGVTQVEKGHEGNTTVVTAYTCRRKHGICLS